MARSISPFLVTITGSLYSRQNFELTAPQNAENPPYGKLRASSLFLPPRGLKNRKKSEQKNLPFF